MPTVVMRGHADRIGPITAAGTKTPKPITSSRFVVAEGAPHGLLRTHADQVNAAPPGFLR